MKSTFLASAMTLVVLAGTWGCGKPKKITPAEYLAAADTLIQKGLYEDAIRSLDDLRALYPADTTTLIKVGIFEADVYAAHLNNYSKAIESLRRVVAAYPNDPMAATCLFKIGYTYETEMKDVVKARQTYEDFLRKYPDHELAPSVRLSIEHLGESDEELLERILKKNETGAKVK